MTGYSEAQNKSTQRYIKKSYDEIKLRYRKDEKPGADDIKAAADKAGESVNRYIKNAVNDRLKKDGII